MPILATQISQTGLAGVVPNVAYIATNDTIAQVTTAGYLNILAQSGYQLSEAMMALVSTKTTPSATSTQVSWFDISFSGGNWSLVASSSTSPLPNSQIFVGNASGVATPVAMSGAATITNTGVLSLASGSVALSNLSAGITPASIVKYAGTSNYAGGATSTTITVTGMLATDLPFVQIQTSTNAVSIQKVTPTSNTITILMSADPGATTVFSYQVLRAAS